MDASLERLRRERFDIPRVRSEVQAKAVLEVRDRTTADRAGAFEDRHALTVPREQRSGRHPARPPPTTTTSSLPI